MSFSSSSLSLATVKHMNHTIQKQINVKKYVTKKTFIVKNTVHVFHVMKETFTIQKLINVNHFVKMVKFTILKLNNVMNQFVKKIKFIILKLNNVKIMKLLKLTVDKIKYGMMHKKIVFK